MARAYAFKDPQDVRNLKKISQRYHDFNDAELPSDDVSFTTTVNVVQTTDEVESSGASVNGTTSFTLEEGEGVRLRKLDEELEPYEWEEGKPSLQTFSNLETTNIPEGANVVTMNDSFNRRYGFQVQPSEVFGKLNEYWDGTDFSTEIEVNLDSGFTVNGASVLRAFPSPSLTEKIPYNTSVTCRYVKSKGTWFFFRPTDADTTVTISGNALRLTPEDPQEILLNVFISEIAANETVSNLRINAVHQFGEITGANNGYMWRKFPTELIGHPQTVADSYTVQSPRWVKDVGLGSPARMYAWGPDGGTWHIASVDFYGPIMKGSGGYHYPGNRLINGETWWASNSLVDPYYVYFTNKYDSQGNVDWGWAYGTVLGKVLGPNDSEPFESGSTHGGALSSLMQTAGLEFLKPEWTCSSEFGEYQPNSLASGTIQLGSPRWVASDGRTGITPFYFTRSWNGGHPDTSERWFGRYTCQAFNETFVNVSYQNIGFDNTSDYKFCLGNFGLPYGGYVSSSAPSRSAPVTFTYQAGPRGGLTASLKFVRSYGGNEDWVLETTWKGKKETANYYRTEGTETLNGSYRNVFGNITKSGDTWTVNGRNATVGNLTFEGDLSTTAPNVFNFQHSITLTFDQFVQGPEFQKIYVCSPEVIS